MEDAVGRRCVPSVITLVGIRVVGPELGERRRGGEELRVRGQRQRRGRRRRRRRLRRFRRRPPSGRWRSRRRPSARLFIWSQGSAAEAVPASSRSRRAGRPPGPRAALFSSSLPTPAGRQGSGRRRGRSPGILRVTAWAKSSTSSPNRGAKRGGRKKPSKTALVLGGGGFTGGVYEIGALRALDLLAVNSTVNNFDVYVGTSAGSFVASMLANGSPPTR